MINDNLEKENNQKNSANKKKIPISKLKRNIIMAIGIIISIIAIILAFMNSRPYEEVQKTPIISYKMNTESNYKVFMKENKIFPEKWIQEGQLYSEKLTDYIEIELKSSLSLDKNVKISGNYSIYSLLEGYRLKSKEKISIYTKKYPIVSGKLEEKSTNKSEILKKIKINPNEYKNYADSVEDILGGDTSRDLTVIFEGKIMIDKEEKEISQKISIPINNDSFYEISKSEKSNDEGSITEDKNITVTPNIDKYLPFLILLTFGIVLSSFILLFTKIPNEQEIYNKNISKIMRKYGSKMICVEEIPNKKNAQILKLKDIDSMISLADELRKPVIYKLNSENFPNGIFNILGDDYIYRLEIQKPTTTLVVEDGNFSE